MKNIVTQRSRYFIIFLYRKYSKKKSVGASGLFKSPDENAGQRPAFINNLQCQRHILSLS